jgi:hypothetical protein
MQSTAPMIFPGKRKQIKSKVIRANGRGFTETTGNLQNKLLDQSYLRITAFVSPYRRITGDSWQEDRWVSYCQ